MRRAIGVEEFWAGKRNELHEGARILNREDAMVGNEFPVV
jgi:hypothetical protein